MQLILSNEKLAGMAKDETSQQLETTPPSANETLSLQNLIDCVPPQSPESLDCRGSRSKASTLPD
jgi:hypothetical protein